MKYTPQPCQKLHAGQNFSKKGKKGAQKRPIPARPRVLSLILRRGVIKFENHRVVFRFFRVYIVFGAHGPAYADGAHCLRQTGGPWLFAGAISDKLRARQHVGEQAAQCECQRLRLIPKRGGRVGKLSPQHILRIFPEPAHLSLIHI